MSRLLQKPSQVEPTDERGRFEKFNLSENPFPSDPFVNQDSTDQRINGKVYEVEIRRKELEQIENFFLKPPQSNPNHLRLGYIIDESFIGRGNGKSAFLVNLQQAINKEYCLDISGDTNKCFAIYITPEPGGRTKTFTSLVELMFQAILRSNVIDACLAILRIEAINTLYPGTLNPEEDETLLIQSVNDIEWYKTHKINYMRVLDLMSKNKYLQNLPPNFPLFWGRNSLFAELTSKSDFGTYYSDVARRGKDQLVFVFSHLVQLFQAAGFNGGHILLDDFERIPDFQSARQKRDFALELRSCLFDGLYTSAKTGFYNFLLVLHAGVPRLIGEAWAMSGMENRAPIVPQTSSHHVIPFEKLSREHTALLVGKYLSEYRINPAPLDRIHPFTSAALNKIGESQEYNAAKILKLAYELLDKAAATEGQSVIDEEFVTNEKGALLNDIDRNVPKIEDVSPTDLLKKAQEDT
jgi:hypothetical protein